MAHYIDADRLREAIDAQRQKMVITLYEIEDDKMEIRVKGMHDAFVDSLAIIDSLLQRQPKLTQVPRIEQETQKKGWMDYGLLISEIGLHRSNAINRIKETKERATEIKRKIAPHDLAILGEYLESAGAEIVLCCLQRYCMDFMFTQDEVKEIIQQEQSCLPGIEESGIPGKDYIPVEWVDACEKYGKWKIVQQEQPEVDLKKFTEKIKIFQERYKHPEIVSIKGAMAFMARMFCQYPNVARQWYEQLPKVTMD